MISEYTKKKLKYVFKNLILKVYASIAEKVSMQPRQWKHFFSQQTL